MGPTKHKYPSNLQRNYYEHIIRDDSSLYCIREYIWSNPIKWETDENNPKWPGRKK